MAMLRFIHKPTEVSSPAGNTLLRAAHKAGLTIRHSCGGKGVCGACTVKVRSGSVKPPDDRERAFLGDERIAEGYRLSCLAETEGDAEIELI